MTPTDPRVSVIVPSYNAARFIGAALQSVLEQTWRNYEVIVVDDGSSDGTREAVRSVPGPIRYIFQANQGPAVARNTGIQAAKGEFICFLDADDLWLPHKLATQVAFMDANPDVGLVFADEEEFDDDRVQCASLLRGSAFYAELVTGPIRDGFRKLLEENFIPTSTVLIRRTCLDAVVDLFDPSLRGPEDRDMWSRIAARFPIACIPQMLARKRIVAISVSRDAETTLRSRIRLWNKAHALFPDLAPRAMVNRLLSPTYIQLGFVLLHKSRAREAREAGVQGLKVSRTMSDSALGVALIVCTLIGRPAAEAVLRIKRSFVSS